MTKKEKLDRHHLQETSMWTNKNLKNFTCKISTCLKYLYPSISILLVDLLIAKIYLFIAGGLVLGKSHKLVNLLAVR